MRKNRLWLAKLATEVVEARGHSGQPRQPFQNGFVPRRLEFFPQFEGLRGQPIDWFVVNDWGSLLRQAP